MVNPLEIIHVFLITGHSGIQPKFLITIASAPFSLSMPMMTLMTLMTLDKRKSADTPKTFGPPKSPDSPLIVGLVFSTGQGGVTRVKSLPGGSVLCDVPTNLHTDWKP